MGNQLGNNCLNSHHCCQKLDLELETLLSFRFLELKHYNPLSLSRIGSTIPLLLSRIENDDESKATNYQSYGILFQLWRNVICNWPLFYLTPQRKRISANIISHHTFCLFANFHVQILNTLALQAELITVYLIKMYFLSWLKYLFLWSKYISSIRVILQYFASIFSCGCVAAIFNQSKLFLFEISKSNVNMHRFILCWLYVLVPKYPKVFCAKER